MPRGSVFKGSYVCDIIDLRWCNHHVFGKKNSSTESSICDPSMEFLTALISYLFLAVMCSILCFLLLFDV